MSIDFSLILPKLSYITFYNKTWYNIWLGIERNSTKSGINGEYKTEQKKKIMGENVAKSFVATQ
jgi:hypothetical protein